MKQIFKHFIFILLLIVLNITQLSSRVQAATNPYSQTGPYGTNCTWYAWQMAYEKAGVVLPAWHNAKDWYNDAINSGYTVGTTPQANSIIVWGGWTSYGHVGYVEKVEGNTLYVWDSTGPCIEKNDPEYQACMANSTNEDTDRACKENAKKGACSYTISPDLYGITGYIYLNYAPKVTTPSPTPSSSPTPSPSPTPTPEIIPKSNNTNLKSIELSSGTIAFTNDNLEYKIEVENEVKQLKVNATAEDEKATVEGLGDYELSVGENKITITVKAEDDSTKDYIINVIRKDKEQEATPETPQENSHEPKDNTNDNQIILLSIPIIFIIILMLVMIILKSKGKKKRKSQTQKQK